MTGAGPAPAAREPRRVVSRRSRVRLLALVVAGLAVVAVLATAAIQGSLVYYRTPSQVTAASGHVRLGGTVVPGSVHDDANGLHFVLSDGTHQTPVVSRDIPAKTFREGQDAVVEGAVKGDVFVADRVIVRHGNEYRAAE